VYFTEQYTSPDGEFEGDLMWHAKEIWIGSLNNWALTVMEWNLSSNPTLTPHTPGGCTKCLGAITIDGDAVTQRNIAYYLGAHFAPFVPRGSVRIASSWKGGDSTHINQVAFKVPSGKTVVVINNQYWEQIPVMIAGQQVPLPSRSVVTVRF
jgi:glucosylceramidase